MSDKVQSEGHWEAHSSSSRTTKIDDNPPITHGKEASAEGIFNHGNPIITDSHATTFSDQGHPGTIEYKDQNADQQRSIK